MAHYRKIDVAIWNDEKFSSMKNSGKLAFVFLLTHPGMTGIGAMRATATGLAAELGLSQKEFSEVFASGMAVFSAEENCVFIPNFIKYQGCESLNVLKSWVNQLQFIPHGKTKEMAVSALLAFVDGKSEAFRYALNEAYRKAYGKDLIEGLGLGLGLGKALPKAYPVSSKQLGKPASKSIAREVVAGVTHSAPAIGTDGRWHEGEVCNG